MLFLLLFDHPSGAWSPSVPVVWSQCAQLPPLTWVASYSPYRVDELSTLHRWLVLLCRLSILYFYSFPRWPFWFERAWLARCHICWHSRRALQTAGRTGRCLGSWPVWAFPTAHVWSVHSHPSRTTSRALFWSLHMRGIIGPCCDSFWWVLRTAPTIFQCPHWVMRCRRLLCGGDTRSGGWIVRSVVHTLGRIGRFCWNLH